jgi:glycopeptide antibiotics resistance protein
MLISKKNLLYILFLSYFLMLMIVSFLGIDIYRLRTPIIEGIKSNLVPFKTLSGFVFRFDHYNFDTWFYNTFGPFIIFIPLGFLLPYVFLNLKTLKITLCFSFLLSICIEVMQFVTKLGVLDIDDIILNSGGAAFGFFIFKKYNKFFHS